MIMICLYHSSVARGGGGGGSCPRAPPGGGASKSCQRIFLNLYIEKFKKSERIQRKCSHHILDFGATPPPHKISNNILIYLTSYRILAPPPPISLSLRSLSIVASGEGGPKSYK